jgi:hypothetical protein
MKILRIFSWTAGESRRQESPQSLPDPLCHQDSPDGAQGSIVFAMNLTNQGEEVDFALKEFPPAVEKLSSCSPVWRKIMVTVSGGLT